jgi:hypothetical protein
VPWVLVDVALVLVALVVLLMVVLSVWRAVKGLSREVTAAGTTIGAKTDELARLQSEAPRR